MVTEIQINSEFSIDQSFLEAEKYGFLLGQLSKGLRKHVETMWIHKGEDFLVEEITISLFTQVCLSFMKTILPVI